MSRKKSVAVETAVTTATARKQASAAKPKTKLARLEMLLRRPDGATIEQISAVGQYGQLKVTERRLGAYEFAGHGWLIR